MIRPEDYFGNVPPPTPEEIIANYNSQSIVPVKTETEKRLEAIEQAISAIASSSPSLSMLPEVMAMEAGSPVIATEEIL